MSKTTNLGNLVTSSFLLLVMVESAFAGQIIYVDTDAPGSNNGLSWLNAYSYLQVALDAASSGDIIRVAEGTYKPHEGIVNMPENEREVTFQLKNGVTVEGGYAGYGEPEPNARNVGLYETILSGDLDGNDGEAADVEDLLYDPNRAENSYHVVTGSGTNTTACLDGFTITGG